MTPAISERRTGRSRLGARPGGWRDFHYVVSSPSVRGTLAVAPGQLGEVRRALDLSTVVASFRTGQNRFEVRKIREVARANWVPMRQP